MLKAIDHKTWPILSKLDDIMPRSTASGRFAHDGANEEIGDRSSGDSDIESASGLTQAADQGLFIPLFPPSFIAPFIALSKTGHAIASTSAFTAPSPYSRSSDAVLPSRRAPLPPLSSAPSIQTSISPSLPASSSSLPASSSSTMPASSLPQAVSSPSPATASISSKGKRKQSAVLDLDDHGSLKRRGPCSPYSQRSH